MGIWKSALAIFLGAIFCEQASAQINVFDPIYQGKPSLDFDAYYMPAIRVFAMNYDDLDSVRKLDKFELGVQLPESILSRIYFFFESGRSEEALNPFDPQDIDLIAEFTYLGDSARVEPKRVNGFYYKEYRRNSNLKSWSLITNQNLPDFRVRFAPPTEGLWECVVSVKVRDTEEPMTAGAFQFVVKDAGLPGYVHVGENGRYLQLDDEMFLPLGMNLPTQGGTATGYTETGANPADYMAYLDRLRDLRSSGGNYFRYLATPWTTEIEFEKLGDYGNRLPQAWEMDRLVDELAGLDLRMHFNLSYTTPLTYTGVFSLFHWDWSNASDSYLKCDALPNWFPNDPGYCYHSDSTYGVETIDEFLTDPELIRYYQNRIRYIVSRWGYSTHIGAFELMNEINFSGVRYAIAPNCTVDPATFEDKPYFNDTAYVRKLCQWQIEMARYIKEDLGHYEHPFCVNYGGTPNYVPAENYHFDNEDGISLMAGDSTYFSKYIDVISYNDYYKWFKKFQYESEDIRKLEQFDKNVHTSGEIHEKPLLFSEIGVGLHGCDNQFTFKQMYVMSPFTGAAGAGMAWHYNNNTPDYDSIQDRLDAWSIMPVVANFFDGINLDEGPWRAGNDVRNDNKAEMLYLKNRETDANQAVAVVSNRTVNRYTMREPWCDENPGACDCSLSEDELARIEEVYKTPVSVAWNDGRGVRSSQMLKIEQMGYVKKYQLLFYDGLTGSFVAAQTKWTDALGRLKIEYPDLANSPYGQDDEANGSMLLVKIFREGEPGFDSVRTR